MYSLVPFLHKNYICTEIKAGMIYKHNKMQNVSSREFRIPNSLGLSVLSKFSKSSYITCLIFFVNASFDFLNYFLKSW